MAWLRGGRLGFTARVTDLNLSFSLFLLFVEYYAWHIAVRRDLQSRLRSSFCLRLVYALPPPPLRIAASITTYLPRYLTKEHRPWVFGAQGVCGVCGLELGEWIARFAPDLCLD